MYVPNYFTRKVSLIDPDTNTVTAMVKVGRGPRYPVALPDGSAVHIPDDAQTVSVV